MQVKFLNYIIVITNTVKKMLVLQTPLYLHPISFCDLAFHRLLLTYNTTTMK